MWAIKYRSQIRKQNKKFYLMILYIYFVIVDWKSSMKNSKIKSNKFNQKLFCLNYVLQWIDKNLTCHYMHYTIFFLSCFENVVICKWQKSYVLQLCSLRSRIALAVYWFPIYSQCTIQTHYDINLDLNVCVFNLNWIIWL